MTTITAPRIDLDLSVRTIDWSDWESITAEDIAGLYRKHDLYPRTGGETVVGGGTCAVGVVRIELNLNMREIRELWPLSFIIGVILGFDGIYITRSDEITLRGYELGAEVRRLVF